MKISLNFNAASHTSEELIVVGTFSKTQSTGKKEETVPVLTSWPKDFRAAYEALNSKDQFNGAKGTSFYFDVDGVRVMAYGLGEKKNYNDEALRHAAAKTLKASAHQVETLSYDLDSFLVKGNLDRTIHVMAEALELTAYNFDKYKSKKSESKVKNVLLDSKAKKTALRKAQKALDDAMITAESINLARSFVNEPPNTLNSETYAKMVQADIKGTKGVKVKVHGKAMLKKEKMGMFLAVNQGSAFQPQLVELTYTPAKVTKNTKHVILVGKGLTFDTGGYSLKPSNALNNMKFDMAGSSTVYGAFRAAAKLGINTKITCFMGLTDNAVSKQAIMPDSIVTARNGKTVEILNTDAEGRLVLGDILSYASDMKPDAIIDVATLTGACLVALGTEVCGLMGNDDKLATSLKKAAKSCDENIWELPIIPEWTKDMQSNIADLRNIGSTRFAGTAKAAAFLQEFVTEGTSWAHLDIAGIGDAQSHLPYCPAKGGSGIMIRTLLEYAKNA